jgi:proline iminopeptidase
MPIATTNGLHFDFETHGPDAAPAVLLIQGLGMPAAMWPDPFVDTLVAEGYRVITFDNRDSGASSRLADAGVPSIPRSFARALLRRPVTAPYTLDDMADDAIAVLDAAAVPGAHVVGVSMGGMIAQVLAARHPRRVLSLTSIMSTTGNPHPAIALGKARALRALLRRPPREPTLEQAVAHLGHVFEVIGSPGFRQDPLAKRALFERAARRGINPPGTARQLAAIMASGDRRAMLRTITAPTLVIHGADDPLVRVAGGIDTARNIRGARLKIVPGMGHDFPPQLLRGIAVLIAEHCRTAVSADAATP